MQLEMAGIINAFINKMLLLFVSQRLVLPKI